MKVICGLIILAGIGLVALAHQSNSNVPAGVGVLMIALGTVGFFLLP